MELISFLGTSVGGTLFGHIGRLIQSRTEQNERQKELDFKLRLADKKELGDYLGKLNERNVDGSYPPIAYASTFVIVLLALTYCSATISCFTFEPSRIMYTKDPSEDARAFSLFFGLIKWDLANNKILSISRAGVGFLMCYPIIFILSSVITGERPKR